MLPSILSLEMAETILFMGRIVWIIRNGPMENLEEKNFELEAQRDIWENESFKYYQKIQDMAGHPFNIMKFTGVIQECKLKITKVIINR